MECGDKYLLYVDNIMRVERDYGDDLEWDNFAYVEKWCGLLSVIRDWNILIC